MLNILIADNDISLVELIFKEIVRKNNEFRLADYTYDGPDTLHSILQYHPDVIILNLQIPKLNGMSIIGYISSIKEEYSPYFITISNNEEYLDKINDNKDIYSIIDKRKGTIHILDNIKIYLKKIYKEINNRDVYNKIKNELKKFKLNISNKGTDYLIDSILLSYNKEDLNLTKDIYPVLSEKYKVTPMNIKWNMEKNIKSMRRYTDNDVITKYFCIDSKSNLTIKTVIKTVAENIEITAYGSNLKI